MRQSAQAGISFVELVMSIVVISVALAGIVATLNVTNRKSADPMVRKQALAIAESMLEEVMLMPFTYCDPDDSNAGSATGATAAQCPASGGTGGVEALGPETGETRYTSPQFDNVNDYHGFEMKKVTDPDTGLPTGGIFDITQTEITALDKYKVNIQITQPGLGTIAAADTLLVQVTVTDPSGDTTVVEGIRARYAPTTLP